MGWRRPDRNVLNKWWQRGEENVKTAKLQPAARSSRHLQDDIITSLNEHCKVLMPLNHTIRSTNTEIKGWVCLHFNVLLEDEKIPILFSNSYGYN